MTSGIRNFIIFAVALGASWLVGLYVPPTWTVEQVTLDVNTDADGKMYYIYKKTPVYIEPVSILESELNPDKMHSSGAEPTVFEEFVSSIEVRNGQTETLYYQLLAKRHWGYWSLLPALIAVILCWLT